MRKVSLTICLVVLVLGVSTNLFAAEENATRRDFGLLSLLLFAVVFVVALISIRCYFKERYNIGYALKNPLINDMEAEVISINGNELNDKKIGDFLTGLDTLFKLELRISFADQNLTFNLSLGKSYLIPYKEDNKIKVTLKVDTREPYVFGYKHYDRKRSLSIYMGSKLVGAETLSDYKYSQILSLNYHLNPSTATRVRNLALARLVLQQAK